MSASTAELIRHHPHRADLIRAWDDDFVGMFEEIPGAAEVVGDLATAGIAMYLITNLPTGILPKLLARFPFLRLLSGAVVSADEGVAKPSPEIYQIFCDRFGVVPAACVYADDREANVSAASLLGFTTVQFRDVDGLRRSLSRYRLLG